MVNKFIIVIFYILKLHISFRCSIHIIIYNFFISVDNEYREFSERESQRVSVPGKKKGEKASV